MTGDRAQDAVDVAHDREDAAAESEGEKRVFIEVDPTDQGRGTVQQNGMLYVGREHAGDTVKWWIEDADGTDATKPDAADD